MADTTTPNYGWVKPQVGGDATTWGATWNNNLDAIDAEVFANASSDAATVVTAPNEIVLNTAAAPAINQIYGQTAGAMRWGLYLGDGETESGANAGSNFLIQAFSDAGANIFSPLEITRATGLVAMSGALNVGGAINVGGAMNVGGAINASNIVYATAFVVNGADTGFGVGVLQLADSWTITYTGSMTFVSPSGEMAEMEDGGAFGITGQGYKPGGGSWANSSDLRVKTVERPYELGLAEVLRLNPIVYRFRGNDAAPGKASKTLRVREKSFVGLVAQDVEGVFPGMVTQRKGYVDGQEVDNFRDLDTSELQYALVNSIKTLVARIEVLEAALAAKG